MKSRGKKRNAYNILKGKDHLRDLDADRRTILKWLSEKYDDCGFDLSRA
jgi:hypothetical protein